MKRSRDNDLIVLEFDDAERIVQALHNFFSFFNDGQSHFRGDIVKAMFQDLIGDDAEGNALDGLVAEIVGKSKKYVKHVCREPYKAPEIFNQGQSLNVKRPRAVAIKSAMGNYIIDHFDETASGSRRPRLAVKRSFLNGYRKFKADGGIGSYDTFLDVCAQLHVGIAKNEDRDEFSCPHCKGAKKWENEVTSLESQLKKATKVEAKRIGNDIAKLRENIDLLKYHQNIAAAMRVADRQMLDELVPGEMHMHGDFTTFNPIDEDGSLGVYVLVVRWREDIGGPTFCAVLYCISTQEDTTKDKDFVHSTFRILHEAGFFEGVHQITHFSDTGTAHFRNTNSLHLFSLFQHETGIKVRMNVYPAYHGHNLCDANAGVSKRIVRVQAQDLELTGGLWDKAFLKECMNQQRGAQTVDVPVQQRKKMVQTIRGIQQYHSFEFEAEQLVCRKFFGQKKPDMHVFQPKAEFK